METFTWSTPSLKPCRCSIRKDDCSTISGPVALRRANFRCLPEYPSTTGTSSTSPTHKTAVCKYSATKGRLNETCGGSGCGGNSVIRGKSQDAHRWKPARSDRQRERADQIRRGRCLCILPCASQHSPERDS